MVPELLLGQVAHLSNILDRQNEPLRRLLFYHEQLPVHLSSFKMSRWKLAKFLQISLVIAVFSFFS